MQHQSSKEIRIPVSYGYIAAKIWGKESEAPVLCLHGWQDNAGTFDKLIPLLSSNLHIVAIDGSGHGLSSHKPLGAFYHFMEMVVDIKRVVDHMKWSEFSIIGHSLGGTLALMYGSLHPEQVKNIVLLDILKPASRSTGKLPDISRRGIETILKMESKVGSAIPVYSLDEARKRLIQGVYNEITEESANVLLKRGCKPSPCGKGYIFSRDIRVKVTEELYKFSHEDLKAFMKRLRCNLLIIKGKQSMVFTSKTPEVLDQFIDIYKQVCKSFQLVEVDGNHFVHLNYPERVAPYIDDFFNAHLNITSKI